ncbi:MAG: transcription-repair coupling factor [Phycisphaerales bacterium JB037]
MFGQSSRSDAADRIRFVGERLRVRRKDRVPPKATARTDLIDLIASLEAVGEMARALAAGRRVVAQGAIGSSTALLAAALARGERASPVLLVTAHVDDADGAFEDLAARGVEAAVFPAVETLPGETHASFDLFAQRLGLLAPIDRAAALPRVLIAPVQAIMQSLPDKGELTQLIRRVARGDRMEPAELLDWLDRAGYRRVGSIEEPGDVALRGGIMDIFGVGAAQPIRLDFFGDEIEQVREVDLESMGTDRAIESAELVTARAEAVTRPGTRSLVDAIPADTIVLLHETQEISEQARGYYERVYETGTVLEPRAILARIEKRFAARAEINQFSSASSGADTEIELPFSPLPAMEDDAGEAVAQLGSAARSGRRVIVPCEAVGEAHRLEELIREHAPGASIDADPLPLQAGFVIDADASQPGALIVTYHQALHRVHRRRTKSRLRGVRATDAFLEFESGDIVVHQEHGIARYLGLELITPRKVPGRTADPEPEEFLTLEFAGRSKLQVPARQINLVQRYVGGFKGKPPLSTLGGTRWSVQKDRVRESVRDLAAELLRVRAAREAMPGVRYPADTPWQREFEDQFPFEETEDQLAALASIKKDMGSERPMDRLICGDVGFGKTEVAIRAAFKAVEFGRQVAVLVPTTVLAEQHERTFRSRFKGYPFRVESLSRFKTAGEMRQTLKDLKAGRVDLVIGTHRLLSSDVDFADLGLLIIDEEQRFGVEHKEKLLQMRLTVDVLTLSATPIPRTLHMSMLGLRDISSLTTPPADRRSIVTEVIPFNEKRLSQAIARELSRDGQVFFVHNRVKSIRAVADRVRAMAPGARIIVGHGQMPGGELEEVMLKFVRREADILVSTTIIESGIDIPSANTMIITDAHRFGLAELHQLRGRVGRSGQRAYCYLLLPEGGALSEVAKRRLAAIEEYHMLGAGFRIAMRDLEIRGAGNLLGPEQSGHIAAVGYDMYCRLLDQSVRELKRERIAAPPSATSVELGFGGTIPRAYIPSEKRRLEAYRRLADAESIDDLERLEADLVSAYGKIPEPLARLLELAGLRVVASRRGVRAIMRREQDVVLHADDPGAVRGLLVAAKGTVRLVASREDRTEVYYRPPTAYFDGRTLLSVLRARFAPPESA